MLNKTVLTSEKDKSKHTITMQQVNCYARG